MIGFSSLLSHVTQKFKLNIRDRFYRNIKLGASFLSVLSEKVHSETHLDWNLRHLSNIEFVNIMTVVD